MLAHHEWPVGRLMMWNWNNKSHCHIGGEVTAVRGDGSAHHSSNKKETAPVIFFTNMKLN